MVHRIFAVGFLFFSHALADRGLTPPPQPSSGPGGSDYPHAKVEKVTLPVLGADEVNIHMPASPKPSSAPVLIFVHGLFSPSVLYSDFVKHVARKGYTVIYPGYQSGGSSKYGENSLKGIKAALNYLNGSGPGYRVKANPNGIVLAGHSVGGNVAAWLASYQKSALPKVRGLMLFEHTSSTEGEPLSKHLPLDRLGQIDSGAYVVLMGSDHAFGASEWYRAAMEDWASMSQIPPNRKNAFMVRNDPRTNNALIADHMLFTDSSVPLKVGDWILGPANAYDFYVHWKTTTALMDFVFKNQNGSYVLGTGTEAGFTGTWSDGVNALPMIVGDPLDF